MSNKVEKKTIKLKYKTKNNEFIKLGTMKNTSIAYNEICFIDKLKILYLKILD